MVQTLWRGIFHPGKFQILFNLFLEIFPKETVAKCEKLLKLLVVTPLIVTKDKKKKRNKCPSTDSWLNELLRALQL